MVEKKTPNRRNTSATVLQMISTSSGSTSTSQNSTRRKSTPPVGYYAVATISGTVNTKHVEDCLVISNAEVAARKEGISEVSHFIDDFRDGDEFLWTFIYLNLYGFWFEQITAFPM